MLSIKYQLGSEICIQECPNLDGPIKANNISSQFFY